MSNSQLHSSTKPAYGKLLLAIYASFDPFTSVYDFEIYNPFGQLIAADFGRVPSTISDGAAYVLAETQRAVAVRFPHYQIVKCLIEWTGAEVSQCQAA